MFYCFIHHNCGGNVIVNDVVADYVIIEAPSVDVANAVATSIGIYYLGVTTGRDCACCGDRWRPVREIDGFETPKIYNEAVESFESWRDVTIYIYDRNFKKTVVQRPASQSPAA